MTRNALLSLLVFAAGASSAAGRLVPPPEGPKGGGMKECGPAGQIDDFEDNNNQNHVVDNRGGYWYTFVDKVGSPVWPEAGAAGGGRPHQDLRHAVAGVRPGRRLRHVDRQPRLHLQGLRPLETDNPLS